MPRNTASRGAAEAAPTEEIPSASLHDLVKGLMSAAAVQAVSLAFKKALIERALGAELSHHLGYRPGDTPPLDQPNHRNGHSEKTVLTEDGPVRIAVPRDRDGAFEPVLIPTTRGCRPRTYHSSPLVSTCPTFLGGRHDLDIHLLADNYAAHKHATVKAWLASMTNLRRRLMQYIGGLTNPVRRSNGRTAISPIGPVRDVLE